MPNSQGNTGLPGAGSIGRRLLPGRWFAIVLCGSLAGVLIWTKLRLATNVPRTAYAVPEQAEFRPPHPATADPAVTVLPDADGLSAPSPTP
jgi:hypothetical protein